MKTLRSFFLYIYQVNHKFPKSEKLKSAKKIEVLFLQGKTLVNYPIKIFYLPNKNLSSNLVAVTVPKRNFKFAVDRNRVKRQLREVYRLNKHKLEQENSLKFELLFLYLGKTKPKYSELEKKIKKLLSKLRDNKE